MRNPGLLLAGILLAGAGAVGASGAGAPGTPGPGPAEGAAPNPGALAPVIPWAAGFDNAMEQARAEQKFVMIDFYTHWCYWCKVLDAKTFTNAEVAGQMARMVVVKVDAEAESKVAQKYGVRAYPTLVFVNPDGSLRGRIQGFQGPEAMVPIIQDVLRTDAELAALTQQVRASPGDREMRRSYIVALALSGKYHEAAANADTLLANSYPEGEEKAALELDRWIYLHRAGGDPSEVRKGLEKWVKRSKGHPRHAEGIYFCAQAEERDGRVKDARKFYEQLTKESPKSWFTQSARDRLNHSSGSLAPHTKPGPKGA